MDPKTERRPYAPEEEDLLRHRAKSELRKRIQKIRAFLPQEARRSAAEAIRARVKAHPAWAAAKSVASFKAIGPKGEVDLSALDDDARAAGKRVAYPAMDDALDVAAHEASMSFRFADPASFVERGRGFEEPPEDAPRAESLDLILVPALAFDPLGYRIGYGAGLYDRTLPRFAAAHTIGIAYDFQVIMEIPRTDGDVPVRTIVTEKQTLEIESEVSS